MAERPARRRPTGKRLTGKRPARKPVRAFAPGRVNLIGEHTDYNEGLCLPFAIALGVTVAAEPIAGRGIDARALDVGEQERVELPDRMARAAAGAGARERAGARAGGWRAFVHGAVAELQTAGLELRPARLEISGDVPVGAGLGSSAALCVAVCLALCAVAGAPEPDRLELARICSRVEDEWVGARTGLLDQLASLFGRERHALRIDMRGLDLRPIPLALDGHRLATLDSGAPREVGASGYNRRRAECEAACEALGVASLRDAPAEEAERLPDPLARRVRHVVAENERVERMVEALRRRDLAQAGALLEASHRSLRDDYEVSVPAVERAVERARAAGALGARVLGGGFGGRVLALFPPDVPLPGHAQAVAPAAAARLL